MRLLLRILINAAALWVAVRIVPGVSFHGSLTTLLGVALVFGVLNVIVKPILMLFSLPALILTLGLFTFVVNGVLLWLTSVASRSLGLGFRVSSPSSAIIGAIVVSIVSLVLSMFLGSDRKAERAER
jgi:putative membrane protein